MLNEAAPHVILSTEFNVHTKLSQQISCTWIWTISIDRHTKRHHQKKKQNLAIGERHTIHLFICFWVQSARGKGTTIRFREEVGCDRYTPRPNPCRCLRCCCQLKRGPGRCGFLARRRRLPTMEIVFDMRPLRHDQSVWCFTAARLHRAP